MPDTAPVLNQLNLVVSDMEATLAFYRRLGLTIEDTGPEWAAHHRTAQTPSGLDLDFDSHHFARQWNSGWPGPGHASGVIGFSLPSREAVDETHADLTAAGYTSQQAPYDTFWGARYAIVEDPDGNPVGLMSPSEAARRTVPTPP